MPVTEMRKLKAVGYELVLDVFVGHPRGAVSRQMEA